MSDRTKIQWAHATWNPVVGCGVEKRSPGCDNCYALRMAIRLSTRFDMYAKAVDRQKRWWSGRMSPAPRELNVRSANSWFQPAMWKTPRRIFVCSMGDLWHRCNGHDYVGDVIASCKMAPQHRYLFLTKRYGNLRVWLKNHPEIEMGGSLMFGVSICTVQDALLYKHERVAAPYFPAHWVSFEPLLQAGVLDALGEEFDNFLWVVCGGETGQKSRGLPPSEVVRIHERCRDLLTPFFFKTGRGIPEHVASTREIPTWLLTRKDVR